MYMTSVVFDYALSKGTVGKIGQLNPLGRYALPEGAIVTVLRIVSDSNSAST
jgi:hypothetical protein